MSTSVDKLTPFSFFFSFTHLLLFKCFRTSFVFILFSNGSNVGL